MSLIEELYKEIILEHARFPMHQEILKKITVEENAINRSCGDELTVQLYLVDRRVADVSALCSGCSICQASCSMMGQSIVNKSIEEINQLIHNFKGMFIKNSDNQKKFTGEYEELEALRGVSHFPIRVKCATLCWNALEQALKKAGKEKSSE